MKTIVVRIRLHVLEPRLLNHLITMVFKQCLPTRQAISHEGEQDKPIQERAEKSQRRQGIIHSRIQDRGRVSKVCDQTDERHANRTEHAPDHRQQTIPTVRKIPPLVKLQIYHSKADQKEQCYHSRLLLLSANEASLP